MHYRTIRSMAISSVCAAVAASMLLMPSAAAANPGKPAAARFKTTVSDAYKKSRADKSFGAERRNEFVRDQAAKGHYLDSNSVDYLRLEQTDGEIVEIVAPQTYKIDRVKTTIKKYRNGQVTGAELEGGEDEAFDGGLAYPSGPGFAFTSVNSGTYWLYAKTGKMESKWWKQHDVPDENNTKDWWSYARKAIVYPYDITGWDDTVHHMGTRTYPTSSTRSILQDWVDWSPIQSTFDGDCSTSPISLTAYGVVGFSFKACESYRMDRNTNWRDAGDMSINWANSLYWTTSGPQEMAFIFVVNTNNATQPYYKDYQFFQLQAGDIGASYYTYSCASTDSNAWCS